MLKGHEQWRAAKALLPLNVLLLIGRWGLLRGALLTYTWASVLGAQHFRCPSCKLLYLKDSTVTFLSKLSPRFTR